MSRVVLIDEVGDVEAARAALSAHPEISVERASALPAADDVIGVLVGTEVPVGPQELAALPSARIFAATSAKLETKAVSFWGRLNVMPLLLRTPESERRTVAIDSKRCSTKPDHEWSSPPVLPAQSPVN